MMAKPKEILKHKEIEKSISWTKISIPIFLGILVVLFLLWKDFSYNDFIRLSWNTKTVLYILITCLVLLIRHLAYSWRLRILCENQFSWKKSIELITIWEFAASISPTSLGGSATAIFFLAQEKLTTAKTVTIVLYTIVLDTIFFVSTLIMLPILIGSVMIHPNLQYFDITNGFGLTMFLVILFMSCYGFFFFYALFVNPQKIANFLKWLSNMSLLKRFKTNLQKTAFDIQSVSSELSCKKPIFHLKALLATFIAWTGKFATLPILIFGIIQSLNFSWNDFLILLGRNESMFALTAVSPTPGGSGITEALFGGFFTDYLNESNAVIITIVWRILTYYSYLFIGMIIVPIWLRRIIRKKKALV